MPNNRQQALLIWLLVVVAGVMTTRSGRASIRSFVSITANATIIVPVLLLAANVGGAVLAARSLDLWDLNQATDTAFWFVVPGLTFLVNLDRAMKEEHYFRRTLIRAVQVSALLDFYLNFVVLSRVAELLLLPILVFVTLLGVVAARTKETLLVARVADFLLALTGLLLFAYVTSHVARHWHELDKHESLRELALPVWLVVSVIPYVYAFSLYAAYEQLFMRIGFRNDSRPQRLRAKLAVVLGLRFRIRKVSAFAGSWLYQVAQTDSLRAALGVVKAFRKHQVQEIDAATAAANRLRDLARVQGTDDQGRQLDRREFTQTQAALRWLAVCQMGRHNNDGRYKADLAMVLDFSSSGLSEPHGVEMLVRTGGQAWFGWRRTITGWCFAIGAAGPTPDQWLFDGPEPPRGFPGEDPVWGEQAFVDDHAPNWD